MTEFNLLKSMHNLKVLSFFFSGTIGEDQGPVHSSMIPSCNKVSNSAFTCCCHTGHKRYGRDLMGLRL